MTGIGSMTMALWLERRMIGLRRESRMIGNKGTVKRKSDLQFAVDDAYNQRCAMSYFRENQRRLWVFAVWLGAGSP